MLIKIISLLTCSPPFCLLYPPVVSWHIFRDCLKPHWSQRKIRTDLDWALGIAALKTRNESKMCAISDTIQLGSFNQTYSPGNWTNQKPYKSPGCPMLPVGNKCCEHIRCYSRILKSRDTHKMGSRNSFGQHTKRCSFRDRTTALQKHLFWEKRWLKKTYSTGISQQSRLGKQKNPA